MHATPPPPPPQHPVPPPPPRPVAAHATSTGLDPKLAGLLCYILSPITGVIFFLVEKSNAVVRFHAAQSIVFGVASIVVWVVLGVMEIVLYQISWELGNIFNLFTVLVGLLLFVLWVVLLVKGYSGERWKLPILGDLAERLAGGGPAV